MNATQVNMDEWVSKQTTGLLLLIVRVKPHVVEPEMRAAAERELDRREEGS